jgi:8-oxo-dGTP pyrophosphatase MutT (NUDIX family)
MTQSRICSKVLLVDEADRVLLFAGIDRTKPSVPPWWFAVGGALLPGELPAQAAIRETREETGLVIPDPGPAVFTRRFDWDFEGKRYDQTETFFVVRTSHFEPLSLGWSETERATIRRWHWWTVDELRTTDQTVFPENLAEELERLIQ